MMNIPLGKIEKSVQVNEQEIGLYGKKDEEVYKEARASRDYQLTEEIINNAVVKSSTPYNQYSDVSEINDNMSGTTENEMEKDNRIRIPESTDEESVNEKLNTQGPIMTNVQILNNEMKVAKSNDHETISAQLSLTKVENTLIHEHQGSRIKQSEWSEITETIVFICQPGPSGIRYPMLKE